MAEAKADNLPEMLDIYAKLACFYLNLEVIQKWYSPVLSQIPLSDVSELSS